MEVMLEPLPVASINGNVQPEAQEPELYLFITLFAVSYQQSRPDGDAGCVGPDVTLLTRPIPSFSE